MTLARAVLVRRMTADGLVEMNANVMLGEVYRVDLESIRMAAFFNQEYKKNHQKWIIDSVDHRGVVDGWLAVDLLRIES